MEAEIENPAVPAREVAIAAGYPGAETGSEDRE